VIKPSTVSRAGAGATLAALVALTSSAAGTVERYQPITWSNAVSGKNFPLFALIDADQVARTAVTSSSELRAVLEAKRKAVAAASTSCGAVASCHAAALQWSPDDVARVREALGTLTTSGALKSVVATMRTSGLFARDADLEDQAFIARSWERAAAGLNNVLAVYGKGEEPRYPLIDSVAVDAASTGYGQVVHTAMGLMAEQSGQWDEFYQPTLALALRLLDINWRDEAGRLEPLHLGENAAAYNRVATVKWSDYPYTVALVPGAGLSDEMDRENHPLNPMGKEIIEIAARRYFDHKVAFIVVSGGYVHPKYTRFSEAVEMKRSLIRDFKVPEDAVIIDPHARHTTTNVRNAARLMFRYGIPTDRPALITTQQYHLDSIASVAFDDRNDRELGYRPYVSKRRLSPFELDWIPNVMSLHADPLDPLDP
jgi:hypothetical protein